jgi:hypothetical protein
LATAASHGVVPGIKLGSSNIEDARQLIQVALLMLAALKRVFVWHAPFNLFALDTKNT